jgi:hypothetical protein
MDYTVSQVASANTLTTSQAIDEMFKLVNNQPNSISGSAVNAPMHPPDPWLDNLYTATNVPLPQ